MTKDLVDTVKAFIAANQQVPSITVTRWAPRAPSVSYADRAALSQNQCAKDLWALMSAATNLCLSADVGTAAELLALADQLGPGCMLKTHCDLYPDFDHDFGAKLGGSPPTTSDLRGCGLRTSETPSWGVLSGLHKSRTGRTSPRIVPGAGSSTGSKGWPAQGSPFAPPGGDVLPRHHGGGRTKPRWRWRRSTRLRHGFHQRSPGAVEGGWSKGLVQMTPGVQLGGGGDMGQQYNTPDRVIKECGSDVIIVGRGIYKAADPVAAAGYRKAGWDAYESSL